MESTYTFKINQVLVIDGKTIPSDPDATDTVTALSEDQAREKLMSIATSYNKRVAKEMGISRTLEVGELVKAEPTKAAQKRLAERMALANRAEEQGLDICDRCGGAGGWQGWPGFTCFKCDGRGLVEPSANSMTPKEYRTAVADA